LGQLNTKDMYTSNFSARLGRKIALSIALEIFCLSGFSYNGFSQVYANHSRPVVFYGNTFEFVPGGKSLDYKALADAKTGLNAGSVTSHDSIPAKINGNKIYASAELSANPQTIEGNMTIPEFVFHKLLDEFNKLPDGVYKLDLHNIVIDATGKVVFHEGLGFCHIMDPAAMPVAELINGKIEEIMQDFSTLKPGEVNGIKVAALYDLNFMNYNIEIKNHQTTIDKIWK